jgi:hypothetical protein
MTRTGGETADFFIDVAGYAKQRNAKKDDTGPTQEHENPKQHLSE